MPSIIDSLIVELGLDTEQFTKGNRQANETLREFQRNAEQSQQKLRAAFGMSGAEFDKLWKKSEQSAASTNRAVKGTSDQATRSAKEMNAQGSVAAGFFSKLKLEALALFAVLVGGKGLEAALTSSADSMRNLQLTAANAGLDPGAVDAFSMAIARMGGNAQVAQQQLVMLRQRAQAAPYTHDTAFMEGLAYFGATIKDDPLTMLHKVAVFADTHNRQQVIQRGRALGLNDDTLNEVAQGSRKYDADMAESRRIGVRTDDMIKNGTEFAKQVAIFEQNLTHLSDKVMNQLEPGLTRLLKTVDDWIIANPKLAAELADVVTGVAGLTTGLGALAAVLAPFLIAKKLLGSGGAAATGAAAVEGGEAVAGGGLIAALLPELLTVGTLGAIAAAVFLYLRGSKDPTQTPPILAHHGDVMGTLNSAPGGPGAGAADPPRLVDQARGVMQSMDDSFHAEFPSLGISKHGKEMAQKAMDFFTSAAGGAYTPEQAAGIVANIQRETAGTFDPHIQGDNGQAIGLGQWHPHRQAAIEAHFGKRLADMQYDEQLRAYAWEIGPGGPESETGRALRKQTTAHGAGSTVSEVGERPRDKWYEGHERGEMAEARLAAYLQHMGHLQPGERFALASVTPSVDPAIIAALTSMRGSGAAAASSVVHNTHNTHAPVSNSSETQINGPINIHTQAKDANAIAREITQAMKTHAYAVQSNGGPA